MNEPFTPPRLAADEAMAREIFTRAVAAHLEAVSQYSAADQVASFRNAAESARLAAATYFEGGDAFPVDTATGRRSG